MKRSSIASIASSVVIAAVSLVAAPAWAGTREVHLVDVSLESMNAMGDLGAARSSPDPSQFIGCSITAVQGQPISGMCAARDRRGEIASCQTTDPALLQAISLLHGDSFLQFSWNAAWECTAITVYQSSMFQPKR
jgi:hypothetical protein